MRVLHGSNGWAIVAHVPSFVSRQSPCEPYNRYMARGWESKSVEQQMETAEADKEASPKSNRDPEMLRRVQGLNLARSQVLQQLENATHERHKQMLQAALAELDRKLAAEGK